MRTHKCGKGTPDSGDRIIVRMPWKGNYIVCSAIFRMGALGLQLPETIEHGGKYIILPQTIWMDDEKIPPETEWVFASDLGWDETRN